MSSRMMGKLDKTSADKAGFPLRTKSDSNLGLTVNKIVSRDNLADCDTWIPPVLYPPRPSSAPPCCSFVWSSDLGLSRDFHTEAYAYPDNVSAPDGHRNDYGTFPMLSSGSRNSEGSKLRVNFDVRSRNEHDVINRYCPPESRVPVNRETDYLLSKEDVNHMCDDVEEKVIGSSDPIRWRSLALVTCFCCPVCGLVAGMLSCRSLSYTREQPEKAMRMLRHSDFCLRLAIIFGIITWFLGFMIIVLYT